MAILHRPVQILNLFYDTRITLTPEPENHPSKETHRAQCLIEPETIHKTLKHYKLNLKYVRTIIHHNKVENFPTKQSLTFENQAVLFDTSTK